MNLIQKIMGIFNPMLSCEEVNQFIMDYMDDNLPQSTKKKFEKHLENCNCCKGFFDQYNSTISLVNQQSQIEIPEDLSKLTLEFLRDHLPQE